MAIRLKEAFARAKELGLVGRKTELAREIWKNSSPKSAYMNFVNIEKGISKKIDVNTIEFLCKRLNVSVEYLFGFSDNPDVDSYRNETREIAEEAQTHIDKIKELIDKLK